MFAVVKIGARQYNVEKNGVLLIDRVNKEVGSTLELDSVLCYNDGTNTLVKADDLKGKVVKAEVLEHLRDKKVLIFKKKRRKNHRRKNGHRQDITKIKILEL